MVVIIPYPDATENELDVFSRMRQDGKLMLNQTIKEHILDSISFEDPYLIWKHLKSVFYRDSPYNFTHQLHCMHSLSGEVDTSKPITEHILRFEEEYSKSLNLLKSSRNPIYSQEYYQLLNRDVIKKDMLLSLLVPHNPMLVDSLMSNEALTYEESKNRLIAPGPYHDELKEFTCATSANYAAILHSVVMILHILATLPGQE